MKKIFLGVLFAVAGSCVANASDGGFYSESETVTVHEKYNTNVVTTVATPSLRVVPVAKPTCGYIANVNCAAPVRVKTHTEVIDHYRVYRPVVKYVPSETYSERRVFCNDCNM